MRFVIVSGMSGAGKSTALKVLEDFGFFCVDNLPVALLPNFGEIASDRQTEVDKVAVGVDIRNGEQLTRLNSQLEVLCELGIEYEILFLDAEDETLVPDKRNHLTLSGNPRFYAVLLCERMGSSCLFISLDKSLIFCI